MTRLFQYRFADRELTFGNGNGLSELAGHSFGNLFITTMAAVAGGFERGLEESSRVLAVRGRILPSTSVDELFAELAGWFGVQVADVPYVLPNLGNFVNIATTPHPVGVIKPGLI